MSGRRAKALRRDQGNPIKPRKTPTPILESSYIQSPVGWDPIKGYRYRSGKQVRKYLARRGVDVAALEAELNALVAEANALDVEPDGEA